jgi:Fe-S cluster assembly protein SufD
MNHGVATSIASAQRGSPVRVQDLCARAEVGSGPAWVRELRRRGAEHFAALGLPTLAHEEWRATSLRAIERAAFVLAPPARPDVDRREIDGFDFRGLEAIRLVFLNGRFAPELSRGQREGGGAWIGTLASALSQRPELVEPHLGRLAGTEREAFSALNTAFLEDGAFVHVAPETVLAPVVHVLSVTSSPAAAIVTQPRLLVVAGRAARASVIEDYASCGDGAHLTNAVTEIVVDQGAEVHHYLIERESRSAFNVSTLEVRQERDSRFSSHSVLLGGALVRNNVHPVLAGPGCDSLLNGLYVGRGAQHLDNHMRVEHAGPHGHSRQFYKGILADQARGVFSGRIVVAPGAQKTDAVQSNGNLLLSPDAQATARPQLEIYADDVKCTHGATIGQLDEQAIFYLMSRGLDRASARALLVYTFASESLQRMELEPVRTHMERLLLEAIPDSGAVRAILD